jgi:A/G-specific adenine glycosylase
MASRPGVKKGEIGRLLIAWYRQGHRDLPWRRTSDPYAVWVSEVMLQQTRAEAVIPYYQRFLARFPTVERLAAAEEQEALALWSGLGYYSRARNLLRAARIVAAAGAFPRDYESIRALPGVGDYTAAAIASMAFGLPRAAMDGNALRVIARVENDSSNVGAARVRESFRAIAGEWMGRSQHPGDFNQALMELGATVCLPRRPRCAECPLEPGCAARAAGSAAGLPVKPPPATPVRLEGALLLVRQGRRVLLRREDAAARRMAGFWSLPPPEDLPGARRGALLGAFRHSITHHRYLYTVYRAGGWRGRVSSRNGLCWVDPSQLAEIPLSSTARKALKLAGIA